MDFRAFKKQNEAIGMAMVLALYGQYLSMMSQRKGLLQNNGYQPRLMKEIVIYQKLQIHLALIFQVIKFSLISLQM